MKLLRRGLLLSGRLIRPVMADGGSAAFPLGRTIAVLAVLLGMSACAPANPAPLASQATNQTISHGTILAMRPTLPMRGDQPRSAGALEGLSSAATPSGDATPSDPATGQPMDFIVREAGGGTIAVVQTNELHFQVGDQVLILRGDRTRLSRPGA